VQVYFHQHAVTIAQWNSSSKTEEEDFLFLVSRCGQIEKLDVEYCYIMCISVR